MADEQHADVILIRPGVDVPDADRPLVTGERQPFCSHRRTRLDGEARRVFCRACDREIPAFDALYALARDAERYIGHREEAARRAELARVNADELLRVERNAKSRVRKLRAEGGMIEMRELTVAAQRARARFPGERIVVFAADDDTVVELRRHLRGSEILVDPLLGPKCWRMGIDPGGSDGVE